jgi:hypothetical protein
MEGYRQLRDQLRARILKRFPDVAEDIPPVPAA